MIESEKEKEGRETFVRRRDRDRRHCAFKDWFRWLFQFENAGISYSNCSAFSDASGSDLSCTILSDASDSDLSDRFVSRDDTALILFREEAQQEESHGTDSDRKATSTRVRSFWGLFTFILAKVNKITESFFFENWNKGKVKSRVSLFARNRNY